MVELYEILETVSKNTKFRKKKQKLNLDNMTKVVIFLPSVKFLNPSFTNEALNTAAIYGSLNSVFLYVFKLLNELVEFFLKDRAFTFTAITS